MNPDNNLDDKTKQESSYSVSSTPSASNNKPLNTIPSFSTQSLKNLNLKNPRNWSNATIIIVVIILTFLSGFSGAWVESHNSNGDVTLAGLSNQKKVVTSDSELISQIAKTVGPSVVSVNVDISAASSSTGSSNGLNGFTQPEAEQAAGTGIIISSAGLIITNRHVVPDGTTSVSVTLSNGTELKDVSVIGRTSDSDSLDIAFLKINNAAGQKLTPAILGDSSDVQVGDSVVAIGNALGQFQNTVTSGIISGYGRSVQAGDSTGTSTENLDDLFQTDAAINEGNSGGPLVNLNGQVIGINTAIAGNAQNIGFAIPIDDVTGLINQVVKTGKFARPYLGIRYIPLTADVANEYNLSVINGAFIAPSSDPSNPSIVPGSPAASAGLQANDVITAVNGTSIDQNHDLTGLLDKYEPGDTINLTVLRGGSTKQINVTLGTEPSS